MGLDMYLRGEKFFWTDWANPDNNRMEDGFKVTSLEIELGYWRKHPNLHGYIVNTFGGCVDECQDIRLTKEQLEQTILTCKVAGLPTTEGFFFGKSPTLEDRKAFNEQIAEDVEILQKAIAWLETVEKNVSREVIYKASW